MNQGHEPGDRTAITALTLAWACAITLTSAAGTPSTARADEQPAPADSTVLQGEGTRFPDMTVEGEDRIRIEFERPVLDLELDAKSAPGLERERTLEIVERGAPDPRSPLLAATARERTPYLGRPWETRFSDGPVVSFAPSFSKVDRWTLSVADSRGATVAKFAGDGKVPKELSWDGRTLDGGRALPGLVYTYVFEAHDKAGNKRTFMGEGFTPAPYRRQGKGTLELYFPGNLVSPGQDGGPSPYLTEAASWVNQLPSVESPVVVEVRARTRDEVQSLAARVESGLDGRLVGPESRLVIRAVPEPDAPQSGVCIIRVE